MCHPVHSCSLTISVVLHSCFSSSGVVEVAGKRGLIDGEALADASNGAVAAVPAAAALRLHEHEVLQLLPGSRDRRRRRVTETVGRSGQDGDWHDRAYNMTIKGNTYTTRAFFRTCYDVQMEDCSQTFGCWNIQRTIESTASCSMNGQIERPGMTTSGKGHTNELSTIEARTRNPCSLPRRSLLYLLLVLLRRLAPSRTARTCPRRDGSGGRNYAELLSLALLGLLLYYS